MAVFTIHMQKYVCTVPGEIRHRRIKIGQVGTRAPKFPMVQIYCFFSFCIGWNLEWKLWNTTAWYVYADSLFPFPVSPSPSSISTPFHFWPFRLPQRYLFISGLPSCLLLLPSTSHFTSFLLLLPPSSFLLFIPLLYCLLPSLLLLLSFPGREENRRKKRVGYRKVIGRYGHGHAAGFAVAWLCLQFLAWHLVTRVTLFKIDSSRSITVGLACLQQSLSVEHTFA